MFHKQETIRDIYNLKRSMAELQDRVLMLEGVISTMQQDIQGLRLAVNYEPGERQPVRDADNSGS